MLNSCKLRNIFLCFLGIFGILCLSLHRVRSCFVRIKWYLATTFMGSGKTIHTLRLWKNLIKPRNEAFGWGVRNVDRSVPPPVSKKNIQRLIYKVALDSGLPNPNQMKMRLNSHFPPSTAMSRGFLCPKMPDNGIFHAKLM